MRKSRYAIEAEGPQGETLLFNAANGAFVQLGPEGRACWERAEPDADGVLERLGFLTELNAAEELEAQRAAFDRQRADTSSMTLSFVPTYACNYRCPYCYELGHNKIPGKMDERMMDAIAAFVSDRHDSDGFGALNVQWYGGDPSLALDGPGGA